MHNLSTVDKNCSTNAVACFVSATASIWMQQNRILGKSALSPPCTGIRGKSSPSSGWNTTVPLRVRQDSGMAPQILHKIACQRRMLLVCLVKQRLGLPEGTDGDGIPFRCQLFCLLCRELLRTAAHALRTLHPCLALQPQLGRLRDVPGHSLGDGAFGLLRCHVVFYARRARKVVANPMQSMDLANDDQCPSYTYTGAYQTYVRVSHIKACHQRAHPSHQCALTTLTLTTSGLRTQGQSALCFAAAFACLESSAVIVVSL
ncbi:hypothetical protein C8Q72DRAFT_569923 [Fomitopsis betulina]|nr:hypothetical protein C8Q72DRAFT_569923 [Fomitopsis betulina]